MTVEEKVKERESKIEKCKEKIAKEQERIKRLTYEIEEIESLEVKAMLKELDMPFHELKQFITELSSSKKD